MAYVSVTDRNKGTSPSAPAYVPIAQRKAGLSPELQLASQAPTRPFFANTTISQGPKPSLLQNLISKLPAAVSKPLTEGIDAGKEALFGSPESRTALRYMDSTGQPASLTTSLKDEGFLSFLGRSNTDRIEHTTSELIKSGVDPDRAGSIAFYDVFSRSKTLNPLDKNTKTAKEKLVELDPTPHEKNVLRLAQIGQTAGAAGDVANFIPGTVEAEKGIEGLIKAVTASKDVGEVAGFLKAAGVADDVIQEQAPILAREKDAARVRPAIEFALQKSKDSSALAEEAKKYKTADEFATGVDHSSVVYHTGHKDFEKITDFDGMRGGDEINRFGPGLYLTEDKNVAKAYAEVAEKRLGRGNKTHSGVVSPDAKILDLNKIPDAEVSNVFKKTVQNIADDYGFPNEFNFEGKTGAQIYDEIGKYATRLPAYGDDIGEIFTNLNKELKSLGYDGVRADTIAPGGNKAGTRPTELVLFDSRKHLTDLKDLYTQATKEPLPTKTVSTEEQSLERAAEMSGKTPDGLPALPKLAPEKIQSELASLKGEIVGAKVERDIGRDVVPDMPGAALRKFESRKFPGELPEVQEGTRFGKTAKSKFAKKGDRITKDLGFESVDDARKAFEEYKAGRVKLKEAEEAVSSRVKKYRDRKAVFDEVVRYVKQEGNTRRNKVKLIQDFFHMGNADMKKILSRERDVRLMTEGEFDDFLKRIQGKSTEFYLKQKDLNELKATIFNKEFVKLDNLRKAMKFPQIKNMTPLQIQQFNLALSEFEKGDEFLGVRQLETLKNTKLDGIHTIREAQEHMLLDINQQRERKGMKPVTLDELKGTKVSWVDKFRYDPALARQNPFYEFMVHETQKSIIGSELATLKQKDKIAELFAAARKSRKRGVLDRAIPTDKRIFQWLSSPDAQKIILANNMTRQELEAAMYVRSWYAKARDYLVQQGTLKRYITDYVTSVRRGFLEGWLEESRKYVADASGKKKPGILKKTGAGLLAAFKESFAQYKQDEAFFNIMNEKTGDVLPLEKFFEFSMKRTGELTPTQNVAKAFLKYAETFEKKKALDALIPKMDIYVHTLTPNKLTPRGLEFDDSLKRFFKQWMNNKKGRVMDTGIIKPGDKVDWALRTGVALTRILDLGLNIPVGIVSNIGAQVSSFRGLGTKAYKTGVTRLASKQGKEIIKKYENLVGEGFLKKLRAPESSLGDNIGAGLFGLFSFADKKARAVYLLGSMSPEEYKAGELSTDRLADIKLDMGRNMAVENTSSLVGKTAFGKVGTQYKSWAVPLLSSTIDDISKLAKAVKTKDKSFLKSKEFGELFRTVLISSVVGLGTYGILSDKTPQKNKSFVEKIAFKGAQDALSLIGALDPSFWTSPTRLQQFLFDLSTGIKQTLVGTKGGPKKVISTVTPGLIRQVLPTEKPSSSDKGLPSLPKLPKVPSLPKLPKIR